MIGAQPKSDRVGGVRTVQKQKRPFQHFAVKLHFMLCRANSLTFTDIQFGVSVSSIGFWGIAVDYLEWKRLAADEAGNHLIEFNADRLEDPEYSSGFLPGKRSEALGRFNDYLARTRQTSAKAILGAFSKSDIRQHAGRSVAYFGYMSQGVHECRALKTARSFNRRTKTVQGLGDVSLREIDEAIKSAIADVDRAYNRRPRDNFSAEAKREIGARIKATIDQAVSRTSASGTTRAPRSGTPRRSPTLASATTTPKFSSEPLWMTTKDAVEARHGVLGADADPIVASGYAGGLKAKLGLDSGYLSELDRDRTAATSTTFPGHLSVAALFRVLLVLEISIPSTATRPSQPNIFCLGYESLFVSRKGPTSPGATGEASVSGRTVRLRNRKCSSHGAACECGSEGLPEAVLPWNTAMHECTISAKCIPVFRDDLDYERPSVDMIRSKNAA